jgi:hypothetical protein
MKDCISFTPENIALAEEFARHYGMKPPTLDDTDLLNLGNNMTIRIEYVEYFAPTIAGGRLEQRQDYIVEYELVASNYPYSPDHTDIVEHWRGPSLYDALKEARLFEIENDINLWIENHAAAMWEKGVAS